MYIDTHSHIYLDDFAQDREDMLERAFKGMVQPILMPAIDSSTHSQMLALEEKYPGKCLSMMGLHPCSVKDNAHDELDLVRDHFQHRKFVAVGETGLDFYWDLSHKARQYEAFEQQIALAMQYDIPVVIHSRESTDACIEVVAAYVKEGLKGVFHCFGGSLEQAEKIMDIGFYLGIGGVLSFKKSGLDMVLKELPLTKVILETDAPYLAPVPYRGKRNEPAYLPLVAQKLAEIKEEPIEWIAMVTTQNAQKLFGI